MLGLAAIFSIAGTLFLYIGFSVVDVQNEWGLVLIGFSCFLIFVGLSSIKKYFDRLMTDKVTVRDGKKIPNCKIIDYGDDDTVVIDGMPLLKIICVDEVTGNKYALNTGTASEAKYPMGACVDLYELNGYVTYDKKSIKKEV